MKTQILTALVAGALMIGLISCGTTPSKPGKEDDVMGQFPDWMTPCTVEDGLAACSCAQLVGAEIGIAKSQAVAQARAELASLLKVKVTRMVKNYQRKVTTAQGASLGGTFEDVTKQITSEILVGTMVRQQDMAKIAGQNQMCVQVVQLNKQAFEQVANLAKERGAQIDPTSEAALYEEFRAAKAQDELEKELDKLR